jgi:hypothetical protein
LDCPFFISSVQNKFHEKQLSQLTPEPVLCQLSENMDSRIFAELVKQLAVTFDKMMVPNHIHSTDV